MKEPIALVAVALASLLSIAAAADPREDFKRAYREYQQHMAAGNETLALPAAETAYETGTDLFGGKSLNAANLALNYAHLLSQSGHYDTARKALMGMQRVGGRIAQPDLVRANDPIADAHHQRLVDLHFVDADEVLNY